jgi:hypothetical protein
MPLGYLSDQYHFDILMTPVNEGMLSYVQIHYANGYTSRKSASVLCATEIHLHDEDELNFSGNGVTTYLQRRNQHPSEKPVKYTTCFNRATFLLFSFFSFFYVRPCSRCDLKNEKLNEQIFSHVCGSKNVFPKKCAVLSS